MSPAAWGAVAAIVGPALGFLTWTLTKRHRENIEDVSSMSDAMGAVTDANVVLSKAFASLIEPLQKQLDQQRAEAHTRDLEMVMMREVERAQSAEIQAMREEMASLKVRFSSIIRYVGILRKQVSDSGMEPAPIPDDLDLSGFNFD